MNLKTNSFEWPSGTEVSKEIDNASPVLDNKLISNVSKCSSTPPLNIKVLEELIGDDPEIIQSLLLDFHSNAKLISDKLISSYSSGLIHELVAHAHTLKSSARCVGALALADVCEEIEEASKFCLVEKLTLLIPTFVSEMSAVNKFLSTY